MPRCSIRVGIAGVLIAVFLSTVEAFGGAKPAEREASARSRGLTSRSSGEYMGHRWTIDEHHLLWWDSKPYVRFGFTGTGDPVELIKLGFDQFTLMPDEEWPISGPDHEIVRRVEETSQELERIGATHYGILNAFWPWRYGNLIAESDRVAVFVRDVQDVTEHAGRDLALELQVRLPLPKAAQDITKPEHTQAVLFDLEHGTRYDLSDEVEEVTLVSAEPGPASPRGVDDERRGESAFRVHFKPIRFPESTSLRLLVAMEVRLAEVPGVHGLPPLWKPGIQEFYRRSLEAFRPAYAKPGLRGLQFGDEINTFPQSLLTARTYLDLRHDAVALKSYRDWLAKRFDGVDELNRRFGTNYPSFDQVEWQVPMHPFAPELARTDDAAEREESWVGAKTAWGLAGTVKQVRTVSRVQDEFRTWFFGHWLAEYAKLATKVIGPVPVFVCSAAIGGDADQYLGMHRWALREGVDGLIRNHYGNGGEEERYTLASLSRWMEKVQRESGCTKHLWANEVGYVRPHVTDDEWAAKEGAELGPGGSFGGQWAFPSQESLRQMLVLLTQYGYRGFNRFLMNPSAPRVSQEVRWMAGLRPEIVSLVVRAKEPAAGPATLTGEQTIDAARSPGARAMVGAYYFDGWAGRHRLADTEAWAKDAPTHLTKRMLDEFPDREPVWGWRDDRQEVMEQQIDLAADHGIGFFAFCWYWHATQDQIDEDPKHTGLNLFLRARNSDRMKFCLLVANHQGFLIGSTESWRKAASGWMSYFADKRYVRVDGKPLVIVFNPGDGHSGGLSALQVEAKDAGLPGVAIAACGRGDPKLGYTHRTHYNITLGYTGGSQEHLYSELVAAHQKAWSGSWEQPYIPEVTAGWDKRPWEGPQGLNQKPGWYFPDRTPAAFEHFLQSAINWMDGNPEQTTRERLVLVYAWNEFGEGGYIAPTKGDPGGQYLKALKSVALGEGYVSKSVDAGGEIRGPTENRVQPVPVNRGWDRSGAARLGLQPPFMAGKCGTGGG